METPFTEKLKNWAERSTFHAIPNFTQTDRISVKILWAVCLIASSAYCAKVLIVNTIDFTRNQVETVIKIDRESDASFPTVTVRNYFQSFKAPKGQLLAERSLGLE